MTIRRTVSETFERQLVIIRPSQTVMPDSGDYIGIVETIEDGVTCLSPYYYDGKRHDNPSYEIKANLEKLRIGKRVVQDKTFADNYRTHDTILFGREAIATMRTI